MLCSHASYPIRSATCPGTTHTHTHTHRTGGTSDLIWWSAKVECPVSFQKWISFKTESHLSRVRGGEVIAKNLCLVLVLKLLLMPWPANFANASAWQIFEEHTENEWAHTIHCHWIEWTFHWELKITFRLFLPPQRMNRLGKSVHSWEWSQLCNNNKWICRIYQYCHHEDCFASTKSTGRNGRGWCSALHTRKKKHNT